MSEGVLQTASPQFTLVHKEFDEMITSLQTSAQNACDYRERLEMLTTAIEEDGLWDNAGKPIRSEEIRAIAQVATDITSELTKYCPVEGWIPLEPEELKSHMMNAAQEVLDGYRYFNGRLPDSHESQVQERVYFLLGKVKPLHVRLADWLSRINPAVLKTLAVLVLAVLCLALFHPTGQPSPSSFSSQVQHLGKNALKKFCVTPNDVPLSFELD
jgi:hypothetical protein